MPLRDTIRPMSTPIPERLERQIQFLVEAERLKTVLRRTKIIHEDRRENDAEHSWYLTLLALTLGEYAAEPIDTLRVLKMLVIHDLVEIDAGDTFAYDTVGMANQHEREMLAADRIFGLLPPEQTVEFRALWDEFEARETPEAKFAAALDRLGGMLPNYHNNGGTWREHDLTVTQVARRNRPIGDNAPALWELAQGMIADAAQRGWIRDEAAELVPEVRTLEETK